MLHLKGSKGALGSVSKVSQILGLVDLSFLISNTSFFDAAHICSSASSAVQFVRPRSIQCPPVEIQLSTGSWSHKSSTPMLHHAGNLKITQSEDCLMHATCSPERQNWELSDLQSYISSSSPISRTSCFLIWAFVLPRQLQSAWSNVPLVTSTWCLSVLGEEVFEKDVAPVKSFQNSQSSTGLHWIMLQRWQIWQMYQMYQTLKLIVKEFLSPLIAMRRPEWMCPPMGPPKHLTCATVARFRTKLFTSRKKDHIETHQNSELWFDQKQNILFLSPFVPKKISHRQLEWSCLEYHTLVAKQTDWKGQVLPYYVQLFLKNPSLQFSITEDWGICFAALRGAPRIVLVLLLRVILKSCSGKGTFARDSFETKSGANAAIIKWHEKGDSLKQPDITADVINSSPAQECIKKKSEE